MQSRAAGVRIASLLLTGALVGMAGCSWFDSTPSNPGAGSAPATPSFTKIVVIGDSLSAGFQNGSLLDTQQPNGWASLVAKQAGTQLPLPLMAPPGVPAVLKLVSVGPPPVIQQSAGTSSGRDDATVQPYDLAVPGHKLNDLINDAPTIAPTTDEDVITSLILGLPVGNSKTQMNEAVALNPTALFVWIGNNDALIADTSGVTTTMTDLTTFTQQFHQLMTTLRGQTHATLIVANLPDVTTIPYLTSGATAIAQVATATGISQTQAATGLGLQPTDLINSTGMGQVQSAIQSIQQGQTPTPLTDSAFLNATEISQVQSMVASYNAAIAAEVSAAGGTLVDMHGFIQGLVQNGATINSYHATTGFLGGLFGLDGEHPTNTGYALIANEFIDTMNSSLKTGLADVDVSAVASTDPLFGPNIKPTGSSVNIPVNASRAVDGLLAGSQNR